MPDNAKMDEIGEIQKLSYVWMLLNILTLICAIFHTEKCGLVWGWSHDRFIVSSHLDT